MKRQLEERQVATVKGEEERRAMELQNQLLEDRVDLMTKMMDEKDLQMSDFMRMYPLPADEVERLLTVEKYGLDKLWGPLPSEFFKNLSSFCRVVIDCI